MFSDEAVLALSSLVGNQLSRRELALETALAGLALFVAGTHNTILYSVLISYVVSHLLLLPLHNIILASIILVVATEVQQHFNIKVTTIVAYTIAETLASDLLDLSHEVNGVLVTVVSLAFVVYLLDTRDKGVMGLCAFRIAKFVLVRQAVLSLVTTSSPLIFHPIMWIAVILIGLHLTHSFHGVPPEKLEIADAALHAGAAHASAVLIGVPSHLTSAELLIFLAMVYIALTSLDPSPTRKLILSLVLYLVILNLRPMGPLPTILLLLADNSLM